MGQSKCKWLLGNTISNWLESYLLKTKLLWNMTPWSVKEYSLPVVFWVQHQLLAPDSCFLLLQIFDVEMLAKVIGFLPHGIAIPVPKVSKTQIENIVTIWRVRKQLATLSLLVSLSFCFFVFEKEKKKAKKNQTQKVTCFLHNKLQIL